MTNTINAIMAAIIKKERSAALASKLSKRAQTEHYQVYYEEEAKRCKRQALLFKIGYRIELRKQLKKQLN